MLQRACRCLILDVVGHLFVGVRELFEVGQSTRFLGRSLLLFVIYENQVLLFNSCPRQLRGISFQRRLYALRTSRGRLLTVKHRCETLLFRYDVYHGSGRVAYCLLGCLLLKVRVDLLEVVAVQLLGHVPLVDCTVMFILSGFGLAQRRASLRCSWTYRWRQLGVRLGGHVMDLVLDPNP